MDCCSGEFLSPLMATGIYEESSKENNFLFWSVKFEMKRREEGKMMVFCVCATFLLFIESKSNGLQGRLAACSQCSHSPFSLCT